MDGIHGDTGLFACYHYLFEKITSECCQRNTVKAAGIEKYSIPSDQSESRIPGIKGVGTGIHP